MLSTVAPALLSWALTSGCGITGQPALATSVAVITHDLSLRASLGGRASYHPAASMTQEGHVQLPLASIGAGLTAAIDFAAELEMKELAASGEAAGRVLNLRELELDEQELEGRRARLLGELGDIEAAGLVFEEDGAPSSATIGLALVLTARRAVELDFPSVADLVAAHESGADPLHAARARLSLSTVVESTLKEMEAAQQFTDASESAAISVNDAACTMEEARAMHKRWAILELARARYAEDRPSDWGGVGLK